MRVAQAGTAPPARVAAGAGEPARRPSPRRRAPRLSRRPSWCRWQIATASASAASCGVGTRVEPEQQLHHLLHLRLLGAPVADHRALDLGRRVLDDRHAGLDRRQHRDAARVPELQRAAHVDGVEQVLDGDAVGPAVARAASVSSRWMRREPVGERGAGPARDGAAADQPVAAAVALDAAVAGALRAGVDAEDPHAARPRSPSPRCRSSTTPA